MPNRNVNEQSPFYSPLSEALAEAQGAPKLAPAEQWKGWLDGLQRRGSIRKEEREDTGIDKFLEGQPSHVSKQQLMQHVEANRPKLNVQASSGGLDEHAAMDMIDQMRYELHVERDNDLLGLLQLHGIPEPPQEEETEKLDEWKETHEADVEDLLERRARERLVAEGQTGENSGPRYKEYQLPGGQNYKEHVITTPAEFDDETEGLPSEALSHSEMTKRKQKIYESPHWDEPNVLVHYRSNERNVSRAGSLAEAPDPKRSLHIEEIQSDWHQAGREHGYSREEATKKAVAGMELDDQLTKQAQVLEPPTAMMASGNYPEGTKEFVWRGPGRTVSSFGRDKEEARKDLESYMLKNGSFEFVPDAPHKKSWPLLAVKHAILRAAQEGHSRISWTPGEEVHKLVGGKKEGQKKFYDEILPNIINDYVKRFGSKVEKGTTEIDDSKKMFGREPDNADALIGKKSLGHKAVPVHYFDVTPEMRVAVLNGQPQH